MQLDQIKLIVAITKEVERQYKAAGQGRANVPIFQMQAIIEGANAVVAGFAREFTKATPGMGLDAWLKCDDRGMSSDAMCHACFGQPEVHRANAHPIDPDDFGRCVRFLRAVPMAIGRLKLVAALSPIWAKLIAEWILLEALYLEELPTGKAPKLYERMKELGC